MVFQPHGGRLHMAIELSAEDRTRIFNEEAARRAPQTTKGNGMAVAALVLGIVGVVFGLIPLFFFVALPAGVLGLVFGWVGRKRAKADPLVPGRRMATWGLVLGIGAIGLGIVGIAIVGNAANELDKDLEELQSDLEN